MTPMQVCREAGSRAVVAKPRYAACPLGGGNPQLPAHSVEGSRLGPFYSEGTGRLFRSRFGNDRLAEAAALTFQQALRAYPIRRLPLALLVGSCRPRIRRPVLVPRPRYSDNMLQGCSLFFSRDRKMAPPCRLAVGVEARRRGTTFPNDGKLSLDSDPVTASAAKPSWCSKCGNTS